MTEMEAGRTPEEDLLEWVQKDNRRFLRAIIRVGNLDRSIEYKAILSLMNIYTYISNILC